jgi:uncharacterized protein YacL
VPGICPQCNLFIFGLILTEIRKSLGATQTSPARTRAAETRETRKTQGSKSYGHEESASGTFWDLLLVRGIFTLICILIGWHFHPFGLTPTTGGIFGLGFAVLIILGEIRLRRVSLRRLIGAAVGSILGILGALLIHLVIDRTTIPAESKSFLGIALVLVMAYVGIVLGANKGDMLNLQAFGGIFGNEKNSRHTAKILDTSVIIDGRIADVCEASFLDGTIILPRFVLHELQMVADSADPLKRQRGRRGLEVLERIRELPMLDVEIAEEDYPDVAEVDLKLIEMARQHDAKIITNDFNLNKIASLQGIEVLNVNQLANALKPVVLPGEAMRVFILREGKEPNQGVAYLDDGTMVVVDGAKRMINKTIDIAVTSVHQTSAGKMIFGRFDERADAAPHATSPEAGLRESGQPVEKERELPPRPIHPGTSR